MKISWLCVVLFLTGCQTKNTIGECKGFQQKPVAGLEYEISIRNAIVTAFFVPGIVVPVVWALTVAQCPVSNSK